MTEQVYKLAVPSHSESYLLYTMRGNHEMDSTVT